MHRWIAAATLAFAAACSLDSASRPNNTAIAGTYALRTFDGAGVPVTFVNGTDSLTITADTIYVAADGSWFESFAFRQTVGGQASSGTQQDGGVWLTNGNQVEFDSTISGTIVYLGTFADSTLSLSDGSSTQIFVR